MSYHTCACTNVSLFYIQGFCSSTKNNAGISTFFRVQFVVSQDVLGHMGVEWLWQTFILFKSEVTQIMYLHLKITNICCKKLLSILWIFVLNDTNNFHIIHFSFIANSPVDFNSIPMSICAHHIEHLISVNSWGHNSHNQYYKHQFCDYTWNFNFNKWWPNNLSLFGTN